MRTILLLIAISAVACSGRQTEKKQQQAIDTAKLFDPDPWPGDDGGGEEINIFKRSIVLSRPDYYVLFGGQEYKLATEKEIKEFVAKNKNEIQKNKFYIITDSLTEFSKIVSVINTLKEQQIDNYRVINYDQHFKPESALEVTTPKTITTSIIDTADHFTISLQKDKITVKLSGKSKEVKDLSGLDKFIGDHKPVIDKKTIVIKLEKGTSSGLFKAIIEVLKKYNYQKFSMVTTP